MMSIVALAINLLMMFGHAAGDARPDSSGDADTFTRADLHYGPDYHIDINHLTPKNFDDTPYILTDVPAGKHREMWKISCWRLNNYFIGLQEYYKIPGSDAPGSVIGTNYHGWLPIITGRATEKPYELDPKINEQWHFISYRNCGRKLTGIHFGTTKKGGGVACGNYDYTVSAPGCEGGVLRAPAGRRMIGIYGDGNGVQFTSAEGIRAIGMITVAI